MNCCAISTAKRSLLSASIHYRLPESFQQDGTGLALLPGNRKHHTSTCALESVSGILGTRFQRLVDKSSGRTGCSGSNEEGGIVVREGFLCTLCTIGQTIGELSVPRGPMC